MKTIVKIIMYLLLLLLLLSVVRADKEQLFLQAEKFFIQDMNSGLHKYEATSKNKCKYHISSIAYGFAWQESNLGSFGMSVYTNNRTSIHSGGKYYYKWSKSMGYSCNGECLRSYTTVMKGLVDFMYLYKYGYGCNVDQAHITYFIKGNQPTTAHTIEYRKNLLKKIEYFEKKYFNK